MSGRTRGFGGPGIAGFILLVAATSSLGALDLAEVIARADQTSDVLDARADLELARAERALAGFAGDVDFSFQPGTTVTTPEGGPFADEIAFTGNLSIVAPVGLSDGQTSALDKAAVAVVAAERALARAIDNARYDVFLAYQQAWLAQSERSVLAKELDTARQIVSANQRLYDGGLISLAALTSSEEDVLDAEIAYLENSRDVRITWLELAYNVGLDPTTTANLDAPVVDLGDLPAPPVLTDWALRTDAAVLAQRDRIADLTARIAEPVSWNPLDSVRASLSAFSNNVALTYNADAATISGSYSFPIATIGGWDVPTGSGASGLWDIGLSVSLGLQTRREHALELDALAAELAREQERLSVLEDIAALEVRSRYQQYLLAQGAAEQTERAYEKAESNLTLVSQKVEQERATAVDLLTAETQLSRAEAQLIMSRAKVTEATLAIAAYAGYLPEIW